jgi:hypothetical protein
MTLFPGPLGDSPSRKIKLHSHFILGEHHSNKILLQVNYNIVYKYESTPFEECGTIFVLALGKDDPRGGDPTTFNPMA